MYDEQQPDTPLLDRLLETQSSDPAQLDAAFAAVGLGELTSVRDDITTRFGTLTASGDDELTAADIDLMESLVELGERVNQRIDSLSSRSQDLASRMQAVRASTPTADTDAPADTDQDEQVDTSSPVQQQPHPPERQTPAQDTSEAESVAGRQESASEGTAAAVVAAAPPRPSAVPLSGMDTTSPTGGSSNWGYSIVAAADIPGIPAGAELDGIRSLSQAAQSRGSALMRLGTNTRSTVGVASIRRQSSQYTVDGNNDVEVIEQACNEGALEGGSLLAAGNGWCSPSEYLYEFCDGPQLYGLVDLPTVLAPRGGVRHPVWTDDDGNQRMPPPAADIGFHMTEEESKTQQKPCMRIPCPTWTECRLDLSGLCVIAPILQQRAFPESIDDWMSKLLVWHAHKLNGWVLSKMEDLSTVVDVPAPTFQAAGDNGPAGWIDPHGPGALQTILSAVELRAMHVRNRHRLGFGTTLEMVAPDWLRGILRADISKKLGIQEWAVSNSQIDAYFTARNIRIQWVVDWQDAWIDADPSAIGGDEFANIWPETVKIMLYPAGTFYRASLDVISMDTMYDSTLLRSNEYLRMFTEEGVQVCLRCWESTVLQFHLCPNGLSGSHAYGYCADPTPPPEDEPQTTRSARKSSTSSAS